MSYYGPLTSTLRGTRCLLRSMSALWGQNPHLYTTRVTQKPWFLLPYNTSKQKTQSFINTYHWPRLSNSPSHPTTTMMIIQLCSTINIITNKFCIMNNKKTTCHKKHNLLPMNKFTMFYTMVKRHTMGLVQ